MKYSRSHLLSLLPVKQERLLVDLGCGTRKKEGYLGVDVRQLPGVDVVVDLEKGLPFEDNSVDGVYSNFMFEHVSNLALLFQEVYRVCSNHAVVEIKVPHYQSVTQFKDPTHRSVVVPETIPYFSDANWYGSDYGFRANFKVLNVKYHYLPPFDRLLRRRYFFLFPLLYPFLMFGRRFLWNVVHSTTITIEAVK